ncbi:RpoE-regulated lipoprotein [Pantoea sp. ACRSH]|uniref:RpoE-regulated lipoprotein n=1 Tax=Pantoea TaxID=53335 RepID=UPI000CDDEC78|nr:MULTISPECIES: RpoE-regulated lipoprotein [Pantoea]MCG7366790.1 RpoE-regulated lipoprotein [Pantoea sp. ACRSH]MCG7397378.1 RpoE-regulated lipoprotein [Pantoea sp. ACRSC]POW59922.1 RpoE-regulated lipoprotein [Pantoea alvi]UBN55440.1 RpoE-regulated lipoprotein [Pantoea agglomerans]
MKVLPISLLAAAALLSGCASSGSGSASASDVSWYNPLSYHWSSALPWNWFGSSLTATEQGVGGVGSATAMSESAISDGLKGNYKLRQGMRSENGDVIAFWQALDDGQVKLQISGGSSVERIEVTDSDISAQDGAKIGDAFSDRFSKAFNNCRLAGGAGNHDVECRAPGSQHLSYVYSGDWHGPDGLMPSDDVLKSWKLSKIIWQR